MVDTTDKGNTAMLLLSDVYNFRIMYVLWYLSRDQRNIRRELIDKFRQI